MPGLTNFVRNLSTRPFTGTAFNAFAGTWVNLLTVKPANDGTAFGGLLGTEWTPARQQVIQATGWSSVAGDLGGWELRNATTITWDGTATGGIVGFETVVGGGIYDALTGGNLLAWDLFPDPIIVVSGVQIRFLPDKFRVRLHKEV